MQPENASLLLEQKALRDGILVNRWRVEWNQHLLRLFLNDNPGESKSVHVSDNGLTGTDRLITPICFWSAINTGGLLRTAFLGRLVAQIGGVRLTEACPCTTAGVVEFIRIPGDVLAVEAGGRAR